MEPSYLTTLAEERRKYDEKRIALEEQHAAIGKELKALKEAFNDKRKTLDKLYNHPTKHSIANHRKRNGYGIKRYFGEILRSINYPYLSGEQAEIAFTIENDHLRFVVAVPFKHSAYEDIDE